MHMGQVSYMLMFVLVTSILACVQQETSVVFVADDTGMVAGRMHDGPGVRFRLMEEHGTPMAVTLQTGEFLLVVNDGILNDPIVDVVYKAFPPQDIRDYIEAEMERVLYELRKGASGSRMEDSLHWRKNVRLRLTDIDEYRPVP